MFSEERFVIEPHDIIIFDMVSQVFGSNILKGAIARTTDPAQYIGELSVVFVGGENRIVRALVNEVGRNDHPMAQ